MNRSGFARDAAHSMFEAMRPVPGQMLDRAAFATYSLDLVAIAALILSLSRAGEQELEAGPLSFVEALETVASRIDILYQKDRLKPAQRHYGLLHLLDRRLHAVEPPRRASFHPKLALARYQGPGREIGWKLWLGSRNLTGGQDREAGLLIVGRAGGGRSARSAEIARMASDLLEPLGWIADRAGELATVRWRTPEGVKLRALHWRNAGDMKPFAAALRGQSRTIAISPFVDDEGCGLLAPCPDNLLLTTRETATALAPRPGLAVATCRSPVLDLTIPLDAAAAAPDIDGVSAPEPPGLHAKLLLRQKGDTHRLWIGSANLTRRGMKGPNAELMAELDVPGDVAEALIAFAEDGEPFDPATADTDLEVESRRAAERALDDAIRTVTGAELELVRTGEGVQLVSRKSFNEFLKAHRLDAWLLTRPDAVATWRPDERSVLLVPGGVPLKLETVLVCFRAERLLKDCLARSWAQVVPFPGHDPDARDRAASAAVISLAGAGAWLRAQLEDIPAGETVTWTGAERWAGSEFASSADELPLDLEEVLAAWARDPDAFEEHARRIREMLVAVSAELATLPNEERDPAAIAQWTAIEDLWNAIERALGPSA